MQVRLSARLLLRGLHWVTSVDFFHDPLCPSDRIGIGAHHGRNPCLRFPRHDSESTLSSQAWCHCSLAQMFFQEFQRPITRLLRSLRIVTGASIAVEPVICFVPENLHVGMSRLHSVAEERAKRQGKKKPGTFDFLGLTHICARSRRGKFTVHVRTMRKRLRRSLTTVAQWCQEHRHAPVDEQQNNLNAKLRGHYQYYGRPTNSQCLLKFYRGVIRIWRKWLNRRTRGNRMTWERYNQLLRRHPLQSPQIRHPWTYPESPA